MRRFLSTEEASANERASTIPCVWWAFFRLEAASACAQQARMTLSERIEMGTFHPGPHGYASLEASRTLAQVYHLGVVAFFGGHLPLCKKHLTTASVVAKRVFTSWMRRWGI